VLSICPLEFADRYASIEQILVKAGGSKPTIGVDYNEFLNGAAQVGVIPAAPMTEQELRTVRAVLKHAPPIPAHEALAGPAPVTHPLLEQLVVHARNQHRSAKGAVEYHQQYFRVADLTPAAIAVMRDRVSSLSRVVAVSYHYENFGENLGSYAVVFHLQA
jgi:hypothetical protein